MSRVIFIRHGQRPMGHGLDELNEDGLNQAERLKDNPELLKCKNLWSSPKKRTIQTLTPLSLVTGHKINIEKNLDQRWSFEDESQFVKRVKEFITLIEGLASDVFPLAICSHSDWLQVAILTLNSDLNFPERESFFSCAESKMFDIKDGLWQFKS